MVPLASLSILVDLLAPHLAHQSVIEVPVRLVKLSTGAVVALAANREGLQPFALRVQKLSALMRELTKQRYALLIGVGVGKDGHDGQAGG